MSECRSVVEKISPHIPESLSKYMDYLRSVKNLSENTLRAYGRDIMTLFDFLEKE